MLSRASLATVAIVFVLAACEGGGAGRKAGSGPAAAAGGTSDPSAGDGSSDDGTSKANRDICSTLDYGHTRSNADYYLQFSDDAAATAYSKDFLAANDIRDPAAITTDARTIRLVGVVYEGMKKVFPKETAGLDTPPRLFTVQDDTVNAFAGYDERPEYDKAPWIFWVHQGTIDSGKPDAQLEALFGHELGHLILRNMLPETRDKIRTHYRVTGSEKGMIGEILADDGTVRTKAEELRGIGDLVGRESVFGVIPVSAYVGNDYQFMLQTLAEGRPANANKQACNAVDQNLAQAKKFYEATVSVNDLTLQLTPAQTDQLTKLSDATRDALRTCYAGMTKSLLALKIEDKKVQVLVDGKPASQDRLLDQSTPEGKLVYQTLMTNATERDVDAQTNLSTADRIIQVVDKLHSRAAELTADASLPIDQLRVYDLEEDADDAAVRILRAIDADSHGTSDLFASQLGDSGSCTREIAAGDTPRYGRFIDPHNATCWRSFHALDLANALTKCPATPPAASTSTSSAASSLSTPMRLTQKARLRRR